jgi:predicted dehydrogenase
MKKTTHVAVVGLGWPGRQHTETLAQLPDVKIAAFADFNAARVAAHAREYNARGYADWRALLAGEDDLQAVILATPAAVRAEPIAALAERGIALFCEKPPAMDSATGRRIAAIIERAGILNSVGFQYRWARLAERFRELIAGRPRLFARIVVAWPILEAPTRGGSPTLYHKAGCGGPLIEQGIHFQDVLRYITGDEPVNVRALAEHGSFGPGIDRDCEETTLLMLRHASGMLTSHVHNWSHHGNLLQLQIVGVDFDLTWHMQFEERLCGKVGDETIDESTPFTAYADEIHGFIEAVRANDQSLIRSSYADACRSLAVCEAAAQAVESCKRISITYE